MFNVGDKVINQNDLKIKNINGTDVVISLNIYKILSLEEDGGGYIPVTDLMTNKEVRIRKDLVIRVY